MYSVPARQDQHMKIPWWIILLKKGNTKFAIIGDNVAYGQGEAKYQTDALGSRKSDTVGL